jgi:predicted phosphoribosyltransferase
MPADRMIFRDRHSAGQQLAERLAQQRGRDDLVVLALPRGGVPVGYEIARALGAPLDVFVVRKLGVPGAPEFAMGAIASGGVQVMNEDVVEALRIDAESIAAVRAREQHELHPREHPHRGKRPRLRLAGRRVILVDDGLATGATMQAAIRAVRTSRPARLIVAVPVAEIDSLRRIERLVDECICLATPVPFHGVGAWYRDFSQLDDDEVQRLLAAADRRRGSDDVADPAAPAHAPP